jgi:large subunit ribosomal protein L4
MKVDVVNLSNGKAGSVELPDDVFGAEVNETILWEMVKAQRASRRRGTAKAKHRGEVNGGGIKPYKQKGTGRARQGSSRAPNHVGGGIVFGPVPRDHSYRLPRSARKAALKSALSLRARDNALIIVDTMSFDKPQTKRVVEFMGKLDTKSALILDVENDNLKLSARNLQNAKYLFADAVNVYDILDYDKLVITQGALQHVIARAQSESAQAAA